MEVARPRAQDGVEVHKSARGDVELRHAALGHPAVEDDRRVAASLVGGEEVDDLVAAALLLGVAGHPDVDRELTGRREIGRGLQQDVQLALVVHDAARVEPAVALLERIRIRLPELERVRRLDVDVPVDEHRGRRAVRRRDVADDQRLCVGRDDFGCPARPAHELGEPVGGGPHVPGALRVGADARNPNQLGELVEPGLSHGGRV